MFYKSNVTLESCTQDLAKQVAAMPGLPGERPLKAKRLKYLNLLLRTGRFASPTWAIVIDTKTGQRYRANGQHSSMMLARLDPAEYPAALLVTIEEYSTDDFEVDVFDIFEIFDNPQSSRNNVDKMSTFRARFPDLAAIKLETLVAVVNGIYQNEDQRQGGIALTARVRGGYFARPEVREFAVWVTQFENARHHHLLTKAGVVAEMFKEIQIDKPAAEDFWRLVMTASHPDPDHETRELADTLKDWSNKPRIKQVKYMKEVDKHWKRFHRNITPAAAAA